MRIKLGLKAWSTLSAMLLALVMISGCNDEGSAPPSTPPSTPPPPPSTTKAPEAKKDMPATPPPPSTPKAEEKPAEKK